MTERSSSRIATPAIIALSLAFVSLGTVACFSERTTEAQTVATTSCSAPSTTAGSTVIFIRGFTFQTSTVRVKSGASVSWVNCEATNIPHTSTSDAGAWASASLAPAAAFVRTFPTTGTFAYHCAIHPSMKATVIVE